MDDIKQNGKDLAKLSIQRRAEENPTAGIYSWWFSRADDGLTISPWWSEQRDQELREFWRREGNDILQGAVSSMVKKFKAMSWVVEGPNRIANKFQALLSEAEFGAGWGVLLGKTLEDYHTQDKGAFWELIGQGNPDGAMTGPVLGVAHLDAQFCQLTGDPIYPVLFNNSKDQKPHKLHATRVVHLVDMPSPNEIMNGIGFCAVSRVIASSQVLLKLAQYKNEKLSDLPEAGLLLLNNILPRQFEDTQANHQRGRRKLGQEIWSNIMTLFSLDPSQPASAELVSFANLPEAFNELESTNIYVNIVALAFGVDVREFWPMTSGALGSARESEVMAQKAKGKGIGDVISTLERAVNWRILPDSVNFRFDFQDDEEDKLKAEINEIKTRTIMSMLQARSNDPNYSEPPVTRLEVRQMLANNVPEYFKEEFLEVESEETEVTDTEREDKANRVSIDSKGNIKSFRRLKHKTEDVLAMAEKNYRDGRIGLDDLLEFRLGMKIDEKSYPGHGGRPGKIGGSAPRGSGVTAGQAPRNFSNADDDPELLNRLSSNYSSSFSNLSEDNKTAVREYTDWAFEDMNGSLRKGGKPSGETQKLIDNLDGAINNSSPIPEDVTLFRAASKVPKGLEVGGEFTDKGFVSTAASEATVRDNFLVSGGALYKINAAKGSKGLFVQGFSDWDENEMLLPRNSSFKVRNIEKKGKHTIIEVDLL